MNSFSFVSDAGKFLSDSLKKMPNYLKAALAAGIIVGIITHIIYITSTLMNSDSFVRSSWHFPYQAYWGRWLDDVIGVALEGGQPLFSVQCVMGIITLSITGCFIIEILGIKNIFMSVLAASLIMTFPAVTSNILYITFFTISCGILLSVTGAYAAIRVKNKFLSFIIPILLIALAISSYHALIGFTVGLLLFDIIIKAFSKNCTGQQLGLRMIKYAIIIILSLVVYLVLLKAVNDFNDISLTPYQGIDQMLNHSPLTYLEAFAKTYKQVYNFAIRGYLVPDAEHPVDYRVLYRIIFVIGLISFILLLILKRKNLTIPKIALLAGCVLLIAPGIDAIRILAPTAWVHTIMIFPFVLLFPFTLKLTSMAAEALQENGIDLKNAVISGALSWGIVIFGIGQVYVWYRQDNEIYTLMNYSYNTTYKLASNISDAIRSNPNYTTETPIVLVMDAPYQSGRTPEQLINLIDDASITGVQYPNVMRAGASKTNITRLGVFMNIWFDEYYDFIQSEDLTASLKQNPEFIDMPSYPNYGFVKLIDDMLVVKITTVD